MKLADPASTNFSGLDQVFTFVLLYTLYKGICVMRLQNNPISFYLKRVALVIVIVLGLIILENVLYEYFLQSILVEATSIAGIVIHSVMPVMTVVKLFSTVGHFYFGCKITAALKSHGDFQKANLQKGDDTASTKVVIVMIFLPPVVLFTLYVAKVVWIAVFVGNYMNCMQQTFVLMEERLTCVEMENYVDFLTAIQSFLQAAGNALIACWLIAQRSRQRS